MAKFGVIPLLLIVAIVGLNMAIPALLFLAYGLLSLLAPEKPPAFSA
jgi:hypothetical protein